MKNEDVYVHADEHGAASTVVKNHRPGQPVSPVSLGQAGANAVCRSKAWASKVTTAAWWVHAQQARPSPVLRSAWGYPNCGATCCILSLEDRTQHLCCMLSMT